mmetsp:Transcript_9046/g.18969  ORF Transcript_9046/g.18969 Transcript_9046/m.18969 type:complete len:122 (-) Transcript_9046:78-443(-)
MLVLVLLQPTTTASLSIVVASGPKNDKDSSNHIVKGTMGSRSNLGLPANGRGDEDEIFDMVFCCLQAFSCERVCCTDDRFDCCHVTRATLVSGSTIANYLTNNPPMFVLPNLFLIGAATNS